MTDMHQVYLDVRRKNVEALAASFERRGVCPETAWAWAEAETPKASEDSALLAPGKRYGFQPSGQDRAPNCLFPGMRFAPAT